MFVCSDTVIGIGVEEEDRKHTWMEDANSVSKTEKPSTLFSNCMYTILQSALSVHVNCPCILFFFLPFHVQGTNIYACQRKEDNITWNFVVVTPQVFVKYVR